MRHAPPLLEDWLSIEKAIAAQQQAAAETEAQLQRQAREHEITAPSDEQCEGDAAADGAQAIEAEADNSSEDEQNFPERIVGHTRNTRVEQRKLRVKWIGWSSRSDDLSWEPQAQLLEDGHEEMVREYLTRHNLVFPPV